MTMLKICTMKRHARIAFDALRKLGAPVFNHCENGESLDDQWGAHFILSGELESAGSTLWADYYQEEIRESLDYDAAQNESHCFRTADGTVIRNAFGIRESVHKILRANGLHCEWIDGGTLGIYDA